MRLSNKYGGLQFFAIPALCDVVVNFDSHISKVVLTSSGYSAGTKYEWTTSGQSVVLGATDGQVGLFTVTLESGYVIDTVTFYPDYATLDEKTDTSFTLTNGSGVWAEPITITSKLGGGSTMSKSYDLSTSSKWANLASGNHTVKIKAKASGYSDSPFSNEVTVTKAASTYTLEAGTYKWVDEPTFDNAPSEGLEYSFVYYSNSFKFTKIRPSNSVGVPRHMDYYGVDGYLEVYSIPPVGTSWTNDAYKTITLSTPQTVSAEFYEWAITGGNLVKQEGETWVLNEVLTYTTSGAGFLIPVNFISDNTQFEQIKIVLRVGRDGLWLVYDTTTAYDTLAGSDIIGWTNQAYRTITFATPPTGDLLTWLQANGTKQGGGVTEHTLTFSGVTVTVDGASVTSPYTLTKDCTIVATANTSNYEVVVTADSIEHHTDTDGSTLSLTGTDINVVEANVGATKMNNITINYTA